MPPTHPKHEELAAGWWSTHSRRREMRGLHGKGMPMNMLYAGQTAFGIQRAAFLNNAYVCVYVNVLYHAA